MAYRRRRSFRRRPMRSMSRFGRRRRMGGRRRSGRRRRTMAAYPIVGRRM